MAVDILYDNGPGTDPIQNQDFGWNGPLLSYTETNGVAVVVFDNDQMPNFQLAAGDVAIIYNVSDLTDFAVYYITDSAMSPPLGDFPVAFEANIDKNFYEFTKVNGETYSVIVYSENLYSSVVENYANTFKVNTQIEKAHYSDLMIAYSKRVSHGVTLDNLRRNFWSGKDALMADTIFLIDKCQATPMAYKVSINDSTFEVFNNKYKSSVAFNMSSSKH